MVAPRLWISIYLVLFLCVTSLTSEHNFDRTDTTRSQNVQSVEPLNIPKSELRTLHDLFDSTGGNNWKWNSIQKGVAWNFSTLVVNPCAEEWQGIVCSQNTSSSSFINVVMLALPLHNLRGPLPDSISNLTELVSIDLSANALNGTIPSTIGSITNLKFLNVSENKWEGSIPESIGNLRELRTFDVSGVVLDYYVLKDLIKTDPEHLGQGISGTIPSSFANLTSLKYFSVGYNAISGSLAPLGHMLELEALFVYLNRFNRSLPENFNNLRKLKQFSVGGNYLTGEIFNILENNVNLTRFIIGINAFAGTIPAVLGQRTKLVDLDLSYNRFHGPLPVNVQNLTKLELFNLASNTLTGTIPTYLDNMPNLLYLDFGQNHFNGTLPDCIGNLRKVQFLDMSQNSLTGTISDTFGNLTNMLHFNMGDNMFRGFIPDSLGNYHLSYLFDLSHNQLSGYVPNALGNLKNLQFLNLSDNQLTSTIPAKLPNLPRLTTLDLSDNFLTGSIPEIRNNTSKLQVIYLQNNYLRGHIPVSLSNLSLLQSLLVQHNRLSGPLTGVFNSSLQTSLALIQVSQNQLTGAFPDDIFYLPSLRTLVAVENCFSGSLPACICDCTTLITLALDGLQSASDCQNKIFFRLSNSYVTYRSLKNGIPSCLYELPNLAALHLSGNGLTGTLPDDVVFSSSLQSLSLSNNLLTGTIPLQFQENTWTLLDLSFNHLCGVLKPSFAPIPYNGSVSLQTNRLSGELPDTIIDAHDVTVLNGNIFTCGLYKKQLPSSDEDKEDYTCGSSAFNTPYYLWLAVLFLILLASFVLWRRWSYFDERFGIAATANKLREYYDFPHIHEESQRDSQHSADAMSVSSKSQRSLHDRLHSVRFICNIMDIICKNTLTCALFICVVLMLYYPIANPFFGTHDYSYAYSASAAYISGVAPFVMEFVLFMVFLSIVLVVYRITLFQYELHQSRKDRRADMIIVERVPYLSMTTLRKLPPYIAYFTINFVVVIGVNVAFVYVSLYESYTILIISQILLSAFKIAWNFFLSYFAIVFFAEKNLTGVEQQTNVSRVFLLQLFVMLMNNIAIPCMVVASISPGCFYNVFVEAPASTSNYIYQQCTGIILDSGCNVYVDTIASVSYRPPYSYSYQCSSSIVRNYAPAFVYMCLAASFVVPVLQLFVLNRQFAQIPGSAMFNFLNRMAQYPVVESRDGEDTPVEHSPHRMYFNANQVLLSQLTYFGMLMTFGVVFPPLAAAFAFTICITSVFARLKVGFFLHRCYELNQWAYIEKINIECTRVVSLQMLRNAVWMLIIFSCCFYTLFLFDTLGDVAGFSGAFWVLIVLPLLPVNIYVAYTLFTKYATTKSGGLSSLSSKLSGSNLSQQEDPTRSLGNVVVSPLATPDRENSLVDGQL